ncbi:MAG: hypothetical protein M3Y87_30030 [Myxococcota bacterium]|nr:hypothetical protein [Myxococcota bacterium]
MRAGFPFEGDESLYPERVELRSADEVCFQTPWGVPVRIALPLPDAMIIAGPSSRSR